MYNECNHIPDEQQFRNQLEQIQLNERLAYIDSVCAALIDSRYGHGRSEGMARNSAWKFEPEQVSWLDTYNGDIFSADVIRRHYFQRECALLNCRIGNGRGISNWFVTDSADPSQTDASAANADAAIFGFTDPATLFNNHSRPPP